MYALLFADAGLSTAEISSLFAIWSIAGFVLEVPSGVWADAVSRRRLLVLAPLLSGLGFGLWVVAPSYPVFAAGFVLWGAQGALQSGALEALVYEALDAHGRSASYARLMGRATAVGTVASCLAMGVAAPVFGAGGFAAVGAASVLACTAAAAVAMGFPEVRAASPAPGAPMPTAAVSGGATAGGATPGGATAGGATAGGATPGGVAPGGVTAGAATPAPAAGWRAILRAGVHEARRSPRLRAALVVAALVEVVWGSLDEYLPLLAVEAGAAPEAVPLLGLLVYGGLSLGGLAAWRAERLPGRGLAALLLAAAALLAAGALTRVPSGFVLIALAFGAFQAVTVVADARLQHAIDGPARSTVTSLASVVTEVFVIATFAAYALGSTVLDHATLFAIGAATYAVPAISRVIRRS